MIEISSQMREFVNFAQDAAANNAKNSISRLGKRDSIFFAFPVGAAADGDSVGKLRRPLVILITAQSRHLRLRNTPLSLAFPNQCLRPELCEPTDCAMRIWELLVPVELRIRFPHRLEPPVPREVEMVVGVFKRSGKGTFL